MAELMEVMADAVRRAGGAATSSEGLVPVEEANAIFVVVPHEYYAIVPSHLQPSARVRRSMIGLCVEHPGTTTFETVADASRELGGVVATSAEAVTELSRRGIRAERFVLGYSPLWDRWGGRETERPVDITYLGTLDARRTPFVAGWTESLWPWRTRLLMPPHEPMTGSRPYFLIGEDKWRHLASSKVLINLHREGAHALEWVRVLEAICNGCVVVSERSVGCAPLMPGVHVVMGRPRTLGVLASTLLRHPERLATLRTNAYETCRQELDMGDSARRLLELAGQLSGPTVSGGATTTLATLPIQGGAPLDERIPIAIQLSPPEDSSADALHHAVWQLMREDRRAQRPVDDPHTIEHQPAVAAARVDALVIGDGDGSVGSECLRSLGRQTGGVILGIRTAIGGFGADGPEAPDSARIHADRSFGGGWSEVRHRISVGRGYLLNEALRSVSAPLTLVLSPDMRLFPPTVDRLVAAIASTGAHAAYTLVRVDGTALGNALPPEGRRLARFPYLGTGFMISTEALREMGGFSEDPALEGLEDHDFWCRFTESGFTATLLPEILIDRGSSKSTKVRAVDVDPWSSWNELRHRSPSLHRQ
jgi:hypothetical protein